MSGHPDWQIAVEVYGDDEVIYARAALTANHVVLIGRGSARACAGDPRLGDHAAVGAALQDLGRQLVRESGRAGITPV